MKHIFKAQRWLTHQVSAAQILSFDSLISNKAQEMESLPNISAPSPDLSSTNLPPCVWVGGGGLGAQNLKVGNINFQPPRELDIEL